MTLLLSRRQRLSGNKRTILTGNKLMFGNSIDKIRPD